MLRVARLEPTGRGPVVVAIALAPVAGKHAPASSEHTRETLGQSSARPALSAVLRDVSYLS